eukprot:TRINITY_DN16170_c0_g1_i3.p1 TRINITY_DN16170_c0_g1~~TRINITY_DN16170_c0_g1_i3.p1  ORF type:complete len:442 (-),score=129.79 TRINITY_DN16170_c0_g1_i3:224-1462(-)
MEVVSTRTLLMVLGVLTLALCGALFASFSGIHNLNGHTIELTSISSNMSSVATLDSLHHKVDRILEALDEMRGVTKKPALSKVTSGASSKDLRSTLGPVKTASATGLTGSASGSGSGSGTGTAPAKIDFNCQAAGHRSLPAPRRVVEGILFYNELDLLEVHLHESYPVVDYIVIVEATSTFQARPKRLFFNETLSRFERYRDKIIHTIYDDAPDRVDTTNEGRQRDRIAVPLTKLGLSPNDLIIITDTDEIVRRSTLASLKYCDVPAPGELTMPLFYYSLHWRKRSPWVLVNYVPYSMYQNGQRGPNTQHTFMSMTNKLNNCGWHCSYFGDEEFIRTKLHSFAPGIDAYKGPPFDNPAYIRSMLSQGKDLFGRGGDQEMDYNCNPLADAPELVKTDKKFQQRFLAYPRPQGC